MKTTSKQKENQEFARQLRNKILRIKGEYELSYLTPEYFASVFSRSLARISNALNGKAPNLARKMNSHLDIIESREKTKRSTSSVHQYDQIATG